MATVETLYERLLRQDREKLSSSVYREMKEYSPSPLFTIPLLLDMVTNERLDKLERSLGLR